MVHKLRNNDTLELHHRKRVACNWAMVALLTLIATTSVAQEGRVHYWHHGVMPPGAIGSRQLRRGGPLPGFFQPVEIKAPQGVFISLASEGRFEQPQPAPQRAGLLIGQVYRFKVMGIRLHRGVEVFPTIEVIDRLYSPTDQKQRFAIPIELTETDLIHAMQGKLVTRVIYLEDPQNAFPVAEHRDPSEQEWFEVGPGRDPLAVADILGRPVAILRLGARLPDSSGPDMQFLFGCPPYVKYPPRQTLPKPVPKPAPAGAAPAVPPPAGPVAVPPVPVPPAPAPGGP